MPPKRAGRKGPRQQHQQRDARMVDEAGQPSHRESVRSFGADFVSHGRHGHRNRDYRRPPRPTSLPNVPSARIALRNFGNAPLNMVLEWLQEEARKTGAEFSIFEDDIDPTTRTINLRVADVDVARIKAACEGTPFHGQTIDVRLLAAVPRAAENVLDNMFLTLVEANYNPQTKSLDLSNLSARLSTRIDWTNPQVGNALCSAMKRKCTGCSELRLDGNGIASLIGLKNLPTVCPALLVLSLANNNISEWQQLQTLTKLRLKSVVLAGNPIKAAFDAKSYVDEIKKYFPGVLFIDGEEIAPLMRLGLPANLILDTLPAILPSYIGSPELQQFAQGFVTAVFGAFDKPIRDAEQLRALYAEGSFFSVSVNLTKQLPRWIEFDRNISRGNPAKQLARIAKGKPEIVKELIALPPTITSMDTLTCDTFTIGNITAAPLVCVVVYGSLRTDNDAEVSFERCFIIRPGPPTEIISDHLHISDFSGTHIAYTTAAAPTSTAAAAPSTVPAAEEMVVRLMQETRLTRDFATQALSQNGWDYVRAIANFRELQASGNIPPQAFA